MVSALKVPAKSRASRVAAVFSASCWSRVISELACRLMSVPSIEAGRRRLSGGGPQAAGQVGDPGGEVVIGAVEVLCGALSYRVGHRPVQLGEAAELLMGEVADGHDQIALGHHVVQVPGPDPGKGQPVPLGDLDGAR